MKLVYVLAATCFIALVTWLSVIGYNHESDLYVIDGANPTPTATARPKPGSPQAHRIHFPLPPGEEKKIFDRYIAKK